MKMEPGYCAVFLEGTSFQGRDLLYDGKWTRKPIGPRGRCFDNAC